MIVFTIALTIVFMFMVFVCGFVGPFMRLYDEYKTKKIQKELKNKKI